MGDHHEKGIGGIDMLELIFFLLGICFKVILIGVFGILNVYMLIQSEKNLEK